MKPIFEEKDRLENLVLDSENNLTKQKSEANIRQSSDLFGEYGSLKKIRVPKKDGRVAQRICFFSK